MSEGKQQNSKESGIISVNSEPQPFGSAEEISEGRRRFARASLLASPILMSVASRPVLGGAGVNCFSNALSGNLSYPDRGLCETPNVVDWTNGNNWPSSVTYMGVVIQPDKESDDTPPENCGDC